MVLTFTRGHTPEKYSNLFHKIMLPQGTGWGTVSVTANTTPDLTTE